MAAQKVQQVEGGPAMKTKKLKAPFPWFGGKSRVAHLVWERFGDVPNYIEPFYATGANLLLRPHAPRIETVNDIDCYVANFWRSTASDPETVARFADGPVNEADLHARHRWLVLSKESEDFRQRMRRDPDYFDAKIAGWWCWGLCCWIGGGWCSSTGGTVDGDRQDRRPPISQNGHGMICKPPEDWDQRPRLEGQGVNASPNGTHKKRPRLGGRSPRDNGTGIHHVNVTGLAQKRPQQSGGGRSAGVHMAGDGGRPQLADQFSRGRGVHGNDAAGTCEQRLRWLMAWFGDLRDRLRTVRVCCGHWSRICNSPSVTSRLGITAVFLDPPYPIKSKGGNKSRDANLYATDAKGSKSTIAIRNEVLKWCLKHGPDPMMRIAVCAYDSDGYQVLAEEHGWECLAWKAQGGYGNRNKKGNTNGARERIYFSPHCLGKESERMPLFRGELEGISQ